MDGPNEATCASLAEVDDSRLRVIELPTNQGCTAARRVGVAAAQAPWIAHLDDDDEWMPQKLELQLEAANCSQYKYPIVSCYLIARTPQDDSIWPRIIPSKLEPMS
ncbi:glycosyltransferase [Moorena bouillonii]|uniref:glycosyltransferase n=1 Tax=Moorena bouillonii TaxID=207920 RepID=UPI001E3D88A2|nr:MULTISPECIES: glycosyltransferase [Moorena]